MFTPLLSRLSSATHLGMFLAFIGYTGFSFSDVFVKTLAARGYNIFQIITIDSLIACGVLLLLARRMGGLASLKDPANTKIHVLRGLFNTAVNVLLVYCLSIMPIATIYTAVFAKPLLAAMIAIPLYGERVGLNRAASIAIGLIGVLIAFQPWQNGLEQAAYFPLLMLTTLCISLSFLLARSLKGSSILAMAFYPIAGSVILTAPMMALNFKMPAIADLPLFLGSGVFVALAVTCVSHAFRTTDSAAVSPLMYTQMIWAILFGVWMFGDLPDPMMLAGAALIILSGIYLVYSERRTLAA